MTKRYVTKGCCGSSMFIMECDKPLRKKQAQYFRDAGYLVADNFYQAGIFHAIAGRLIVTGSFGTNRFNVRCSGPDCSSKIDKLEEDLEKAINS